MKTIGGADGDKKHSRGYYDRRMPYLIGGQDGRVVKAPTRVFIAESGINIRRISVGLYFCTSRKSKRWAVGVQITSRHYYGRRKPIFIRAEWPSGKGPESSLPTTD